MAEPTPGSWEVEYDEDEAAHVIRMGTALENRGRFQSQHRVFYEHGLGPEDGDQFEEAEANATLMAGAYGMLLRLREAAKLFGEIREKPGRIFGGMAEVEALVRDAIEEATGEPA